jgi:hypothetical protein
MGSEGITNFSFLSFSVCVLLENKRFTPRVWALYKPFIILGLIKISLT